MKRIKYNYNEIKISVIITRHRYNVYINRRIYCKGNFKYNFYNNIYYTDSSAGYIINVNYLGNISIYKNKLLVLSNYQEDEQNWDLRKFGNNDKIENAKDDNKILFVDALIDFFLYLFV